MTSGQKYIYTFYNKRIGFLVKTQVYAIIEVPFKSVRIEFCLFVVKTFQSRVSVRIYYEIFSFFAVGKR